MKLRLVKEEGIKILRVDIKKKLGNFSLDVNFNISKENLALLGASGSGKSMTLKCIAGIETPDEGEIILNNKVLFSSEKNINLSPQERRVGLLFQSYALFPNMTLRENIEIASRDLNNSNSIDSLISRFSLLGLENHYPHQLSGGQKQRVALARMIINQPELLMLDEPFSALDEHLRCRMEDELVAIIRDYKLPTIYVSHNKDEVYRISDYVAVISRGKLIEYREKESMFQSPNTKEGAVLIGHRNISSLDSSGEKTYLKDFGISLDIDSSSYNYISLKDEALEICEYNSSKELEKFIIKDKILNIDYTDLVLAPKSLSFKNIYLKLDKEKARDFKVGDSIYIKIRKDKLSILK